MTRLFLMLSTRVAWFAAQRVMAAPAVRERLTTFLKLQSWWMLFVAIGYVFWDVLPVVALVYMAHHLYTFKHRDTW